MPKTNFPCNHRGNKVVSEKVRCDGACTTVTTCTTKNQYIYLAREFSRERRIKIKNSVRAYETIWW